MTAAANRPSMPGGKRIALNTTWNIVGLCAPILVAFVSIPLIMRGLTDDQWGLLLTVWMLVGYLAIFDMGIGRALTRIAAERMGQGRNEDLPGLFWTSCSIMFLLGAAAGVGLAALAPWLASSRFHIPPAMQLEALRSYRAVAFTLPLIVMTTGMIGMLEARQRFGLVNAVRVPIGAFTFGSPLLVLPFSKSLFPVVLILLAGRVTEWLIYFFLCLRDLPALRHGFRWERREIKPLMSTGGWLTVSSFIMPLMAQVDRLLIGRLVSVGAVAYYGTPSEIVIKLLVFPRAWVSVLFPTFAAHFGNRQEKTSELFGRSLSWLFGLLFPVVLLVIAFAPEFLQFWIKGDLGRAYATQSTPVMRLLTAGVFIYCLTWIPFSFLQGIGRADIPARIHLIEIVLFVTLAIPMILHFGIRGAAIAWLIRAAVEFPVMLGFAGRFAPLVRRYVWRWAALGAVAAGMAAGIVVCEPLLGRILGAATGLLIWAILVWQFLFQEEDRTELRRMLHRRPSQ